ncbi:hypothetical protein [Embleya scabrispora]|uniref:hypothetical protein n=1 Tax=Embleya scabrispora TaxID=159449 RepID=UPI00037EF027|nr:hypothetical protein [Embleya scabrispora]MYS79126.1 hypothetical protein [Streptomyces sp. SID5474]MYS79193.1 hypothetical protein [Streptomyces sp. SID5474]
MAKTQLNVRLDEDAADAARQAAETRHMTLQQYIEHLVRSDTDPLRAAFVASARDVITEYGDLIEERARAPRG